jgi:hypothetical protein
LGHIHPRRNKARNSGNRIDEFQDLLSLGIWKVKKGGKKGGSKKGKKEESCSSNHGKKDLSHVICFKCHKKGHYASQCPEKKKGRASNNRSSLQECRSFSRSG